MSEGGAEREGDTGSRLPALSTELVAELELMAAGLKLTAMGLELMNP